MSEHSSEASCLHKLLSELPFVFLKYSTYGRDAMLNANAFYTIAAEFKIRQLISGTMPPQHDFSLQDMNCLNAILNSCQGKTDGICKLHLLTDKLHIKVDIMITAFEFQLAIKKVRNDRKCVPCIAKICSNVLCLKPKIK